MQISSKAHTLFAYNFLMDGPIRIFGILNCIDNQKKVALWAFVGVETC